MATKRILTASLVAIVGALLLWKALFPSPTGPLATARLADGRILQVEGVTFGTRHQIGRHSVFERLQPWLPQKLNQFLTPAYPHSEINLDEPGLVVWVNAIKPGTGKHVDCQGIRVEFVDEHGDLFGEETSSWYGSPSFSRVGHIFLAYPRTEKVLTLQVTPWKTNSPVRLSFPNPHIATLAHWTGQAPPQRQKAGDLEVILADLQLRTNGDPKQRWETPTQYWEPLWELRRQGKTLAGWDAPEWSAEDPSGNHGKFLGRRQPVLRFRVEFYPSATNIEAGELLGRAGPLAVTNMLTNLWLNLELHSGTNRVLALGVLPPGTHVFSEGQYQTNPAVSMGPTIGGAPSGWVGTTKRLSPGRVQHWSGHYTPKPTLYLQAPMLGPRERLGVRLRDEQGRVWLAKSEREGPSEGIYPFLFELAADAQTVSAEVVSLKPVQAEFTVRTGQDETR